MRMSERTFVSSSDPSHLLPMSLRYPLLNRELGILGFNERVLAQAADPSVPLLERLRFICITSSNLDEFFEVRMAGLQEQMRDNPGTLAPDGMSLQHVYDLVVERAHKLVNRQYSMLHETVLPALEQEGIYFHGAETWTEPQTEWARRYFVDELLPEVGKTYTLASDPSRRAIGGASSGAICAFTVAWHRPDQFRNVISFIGSYTSIGYRPATEVIQLYNNLESIGYRIIKK